MSDATPTPPPAEQPATPTTPPAAPAAPAYTAAPAYAPGTPVKQALSLTGFILGIASVVFGWIPVLGILVGVAGLIISIIARGREPQAPNWMKTLGLVFSIIGIVLALLWTFLELILPFIILAGTAATYSSY
jgi:hypothetical protein